MQPGFMTTMHSGNCIIFLFNGFVLDSPWKYMIGLALAFIFGVLNEVLLYFRRWVQAKTEDKHKAWKLAICIIYGLHMILAYWMMLLVMTYETLLFFAIVFGLMTGHLIFQFVPIPKAKKQSSIDGSTPCCGGNWEA